MHQPPGNSQTLCGLTYRAGHPSTTRSLTIPTPARIHGTTYRVKETDGNALGLELLGEQPNREGKKGNRESGKQGKRGTGQHAVSRSQIILISIAKPRTDPGEDQQAWTSKDYGPI